MVMVTKAYITFLSVLRRPPTSESPGDACHNYRWLSPLLPSLSGLSRQNFKLPQGIFVHAKPCSIILRTLQWVKFRGWFANCRRLTGSVWNHCLGQVLPTFHLLAGDMKWQKLRPTGAAPTGCAAHSAVAVGKHLYVFGGMTPTGALNTMYQYHIGEQMFTVGL